MTTKILKPVSALFATALLSTSLFISACSSNETDDSAAAPEATNAEVTTDADDMNADTMSENSNVADSATAEASAAADDLEEDTDEELSITSDNINPVTDQQQPSLVTNPTTQTGTPEETVEKALNTLYYGDAQEAATYYEVDMANFGQELANTQSAFQQTVDSVTLIDTEYNDDKTRATIRGELMLKDQEEPESLTYELQKINGQWKILG